MFTRISPLTYKEVAQYNIEDVERTRSIYKRMNFID